MLASVVRVIIYADGSCLGNPGPGGWAALLRFNDQEVTLSGSEPHTTNSRMELTAAIEALRTLESPCQVDFYTDSQYLYRGVTEWLLSWKEQGWQRKTGALANIELWQALDELTKRHKITWHWLPSHSRNPDNQRVDQMARQAMKRLVDDQPPD